jgi:hypothetical protein
MGQKLSPEQLALYNRIDEILWLDWDPIGVNDEAAARDEYHSYLPEVFRLVLEHAPVLEIATYLQSVANERMGFGSTIREHMAVAEKIHQLESI